MYTYEVLLQTLVSGGLMGFVYALIAIGFTLLLGVVRYVNFAHGQLTMLAMYLGYFAYEQFGIGPYLSAAAIVPLILLISAIVYLAIGRKALAGGEPAQVLSTIGLLLIFQSLVILIWGPTDRAVTLPYSTAVYVLPGLRISQPLVWAAGIAVVLVLALFYFLGQTDLGKAIRATASNQTGALLAGIRTRYVFLGAMLIAGGLEAAAGIVITPIAVVSPLAGFAFILKAFVIVVLSGLGSVGGALVVSLGLGVVEAMANLLIGSKLSTAAIFLLLILMMLARPAGLFSKAPAEYV